MQGEIIAHEAAHVVVWDPCQDAGKGHTVRPTTARTALKPGRFALRARACGIDGSPHIASAKSEQVREFSTNEIPSDYPSRNTP
jgi:hypothetical protein